MTNQNTISSQATASLAAKMFEQGKVENTLSKDKVACLLAEQDEICDPERVCYYDSLELLAEKVRSNSTWSQGEVFVYAGGKDDFVIMKQIAPSSCEMLTITNHGYMDVMTAYGFEQAELVTTVCEHMQGKVNSV